MAERSLSRPDPEQEALTNLTPHKAMLLVADPEDGRLLPEYRDEWESQLSPLSVGCRLALWWPDYQEGQVLSPEQRLGDFEGHLEAVLGPALTSPSSRGNAPPSPTAPSLTPERVLQSLLYLRYGLLGETPPTLD